MTILCSPLVDDGQWFNVYSHGQSIGRSQFNSRDPYMGVVEGVFEPSELYPTVEPVFRLLLEAGITLDDQDDKKLEQYRSERDGLELTVESATGEVFANKTIDIEDLYDEIGERNIRIFLDDPTEFNRFCEAAGQPDQAE